MRELHLLLLFSVLFEQSFVFHDLFGQRLFDDTAYQDNFIKMLKTYLVKNQPLQITKIVLSARLDLCIAYPQDRFCSKLNLCFAKTRVLKN
jgi:hypothetical protein